MSRQALTRVVESEVVREQGCFPTRIVMISELLEPEFSTHVEVMPPGKAPYLILGHFNMSEQQAGKDFHRRLAKLIRW